jgi:hypothetical protein
MIDGIPGWGLKECILHGRQLDEMRRIEGHWLYAIPLMYFKG